MLKGLFAETARYVKYKAIAPGCPIANSGWKACEADKVLSKSGLKVYSPRRQEGK